MIESSIIKRLIVKTFMQNSDADICRVAKKVMDLLLTRFMQNEHVLVPSRNLDGKICERTGSIYKIATPEAVAEVPFEEIVRKSKVDFCDVCYFLECITMVTPLGRIVIENVFDRITQPEFGRRVIPDQLNIPSRGSPNCSQVPGRHTSQNAEIGLSATQSLRPSSQPERPRLDFSTLRPYSLPGVDEKDLVSIIRIYIFFSTFGENLKVEKFTIEEMADAIRNPEYSSSIIFRIHTSLIEMIEKDAKAQGPRFLGELAVLVEDLPDFDAASPIYQGKKRMPFDAENWKSQVKVLVQNLAKDLDSDRILRFVDFAKKDYLALRIEFICFLLDVVSFTESMRDLVSSCQIRAEKPKADQLKRRTYSNANAEPQKQKVELGNVSFKNPSNPLRAHIGRYKDCVLLLVDDLIILKNKLSFYLIGSAEARVILKSLDTNSKTERITSANLGGVVDALFKS